MISIETSDKINFNIFVANDSVLELLNLRLHRNIYNKIGVEVYAKPTNRFTYALPSTCYPKQNINDVPKELERHAVRIKNLIFIILLSYSEC